VHSLLGYYNQIIVAYNLLCPKDISYRSEAVADFV